MQNRRSIATAAAVLALGAVLAGCTAAVEPAVSFAAEKLTISVQPMVVGQAVSETLPEAMGGKQKLTYSLVPDVPGLTFDPATRVLSGTPTMAGTYDDMTYTAKDAATGGTMESVKFVITVDARPVSLDERIRGTWQYMEDWYEDDQMRGTLVDYLTFTTSRFILVRSHFDMEGNLDDSWQNRGTWEINDREIVRIWYHDHDDNDDTPDVLTNLPKSYVLRGDELLIHRWGNDNTEEVERGYDRMTRVADLPDLIGIWRGTGDYDEEDDDGNVLFVQQTFTLEITASTYTYTYTEQDSRNRELHTESESGSWEHDLAELFIWVTPTSVTPPEEEGDDQKVGHRRRWAYAPMSGLTAIRVSHAWNENRYDPQTNSWSEDPDVPYGDYWLVLEKQ